jgi:hypothetical protein
MWHHDYPPIPSATCAVVSVLSAATDTVAWLTGRDEGCVEAEADDGMIFGGGKPDMDKKGWKCGTNVEWTKQVKFWGLYPLILVSIAGFHFSFQMLLHLFNLKIQASMIPRRRINIRNCRR